MLSPTSPAQKNLSEEDSSGSEAGLEPETDRFGFILTNGSTAGSAGPPPELVRQRETKWINIISQWDRILLKKTSKVKVQCQKGIPASLRAKCWPLLCGASEKMKLNENLYKSLDSQPALQSWVDVIERDLDRQFPFHEMFLSKDGHGQRGLFRVLKAYTQYQPEEGYCQAQGPVAAVLLMNMPAEEAFWCLVQISEQYLPGYYSPLLEGVLFDAALLTWALKRTCPAVHKHLQHHGVEPLMFATDWLMCLFTRHLPFNTLLRVWDLFFCYGVRALLQVAVVLVRRVLGRTEQRKHCQGQMETLERLRGVREQVQEDDDTFVAEVCSVQLSARDLERQTEKELEKWRKDRPSSTFDPRGRCQGHRMAWARARQSKEERDRKEREKGNLTVPLARSASTLSLSPSLLHRWGKGGKANKREWEGGHKVVRHFSMGAKEDWRSRTEFHFKKVQDVQEEEDASLEELNLKGQTEQKEPVEEPKKIEIQNMPTKPEEEKVVIEQPDEEMETRITEKEESQLKETEEQMEETNVETEQSKGAAKDQTVENILQPAEHKQAEELDSNCQSDVLEQQSHLEIEVKDTNEETEVAQNEHTAAEEVNQTEAQKDAADTDKNTEVETQEGVNTSEEQMIRAGVKPEGTDTENVQQTQVDPVTAETSPGSETDREVEASTVKDPTIETETETETQQLQEVITETDGSSQGDASEGKCHSTESLAETDTKEEAHTQTEEESDELPQTQEEVKGNAATQESEAEIVQIDSKTKTETLTPSSPECTQLREDIDLAGDTQADTPDANGTVTESSEALEKECDAVAPETTQEGERRLTDQTQAEETPTESQINETTDSIAPPLEEMTSTQDEAVTLTAAKSDGKASSEGTSTSEERVREQPSNLAVMGAVEEEESTETVQENTAGEDDVFIFTEPADSPNTDGHPQLQDEHSHLVTDQTEWDNSGLTQASGHRSIRSSGDFCIRKSSNSHGSRLARRLSEDLFTMPEKASQSQSTPNHREVKHGDSGAVNPTPSPPDVTSEVTASLSAEVSERTAAQQPPDPPKRFGLFHRLRGEQPKKAQRIAKVQVPKILIQDFSDGTGMGKPVCEEQCEDRLSSRERRRKRRDRGRREKEEERLRKKREKELGKGKERETRKQQTRGKSFQTEKGSSDVTESAETGSQMLRDSASYAESYF